MSEPAQELVAVDADGRFELTASGADVRDLESIISQTRELIRYVDNARDAALLVRRSSATEKLLSEVFRSCRLLEERQFELKQDVGEAHLRTQRRAGELLAQREKHSGGRPPVKDSEEATAPKPPSPHQLGIDSHESHRWQLIASVPAEVFEEHIADCRAARHELTTAAVLLLAARLRREEAESEQEPVSARQATLAEYQKARPHLWSVIWLDPVRVASGMDPTRRHDETAAVRRLRIWLDDYARELRAQ